MTKATTGRYWLVCQTRPRSVSLFSLNVVVDNMCSSSWYLAVLELLWRNLVVRVTLTVSSELEPSCANLSTALAVMKKGSVICFEMLAVVIFLLRFQVKPVKLPSIICESVEMKF